MPVSPLCPRPLVTVPTLGLTRTGGACYNAAVDLIATHPEQLGSEYNFRRLKPYVLFSRCFPPLCPMPVYLINLLL